MTNFPPTFVIHCPETKLPEGRRELAAREFARQGIYPLWVRGVHGNTLGIEASYWHHREPAARQDLIEGCREVVRLGEYGMPDKQLLEELRSRALSPHRHAYKIDPGHLGLILSHRLCWELAWQMDLPEVLICEDDVRFEVGFAEMFAERRAALPADWDIWFCGTLQREQPGVSGTHCYLCRRSAIRVLLDRCWPLNTHADAMIDERALPHLRWYVAWPSLAGQHSAEGSWPHAVGI